jgi:hypothetical protein
MSLVARQPGRLRVGDEVRISYGDKSNEELLLLYGTAPPLCNTSSGPFNGLPVLASLFMVMCKRAS